LVEVEIFGYIGLASKVDWFVKMDIAYASKKYC